MKKKITAEAYIGDLAFINQQPYLQAFIEEHQIDLETINRYLNSFFEVADDLATCQHCQGLNECPKRLVGALSQLTYTDGYIDIQYEKCHYYQEYQLQEQIKNNLITIGDVFLASRKDEVFINQKRRTFIKFYQKYLKDENKDVKGCYLYGTYGSGKSYIYSELAKELAQKGQKVILAYYPDLVALMKSLITKPVEQEKLIKALKETDVLMIDDFGGIMLTEYVRDELLLPILHARTLHRKATFMTSNLNHEELADYLVNSKNAPDKSLGYRVYERIISLMTFIEYDSQNYRQNK